MSPNEFGAKSSRLPESQSYGQINANNKVQINASYFKVLTSTNQSEKGVAGSPSEVTLKQQLLSRINKNQPSAGNSHSQTATAASLDNRIRDTKNEQAQQNQHLNKY